MAAWKGFTDIPPNPDPPAKGFPAVPALGVFEETKASKLTRLELGPKKLSGVFRIWLEVVSGDLEILGPVELLRAVLSPPFVSMEAHGSCDALLGIGV